MIDQQQDIERSFQMKSSGAAAFILLLGGICIAAAQDASPSSTGSPMIAIEKMAIGSAPAEFYFARTGEGAPAQWAVVADTSAARGRAIEQISTDTTDYRFPLAIYQQASANNVDVTVRFKAMAGKIDQAGGIAVRLSDADNYYVVRANALEDNVRFYRVVKGKREHLEGANVKVIAGEWHTLGLRAEGERFAIEFDGRKLFSASDQTFTGSGRVALWTKADSVTRFDQIRIRVLP